MSNTIYELLGTMPKLELHLHLEGAIRFDTASELYNKHSHKKSFDISILKKTEQYESLKQFVSTMKYVSDACLKNQSDYGRIAYELFCDLDKSNTIYAEVSYDPTRALRIGITPESIMEAVAEAKYRAEAENRIRIGLILGLDHETNPDTAEALIDIALKDKKHYGIVGIDLHGNEAAASPSRFAHIFEHAREAGLGLRAHAGECWDSKHIWESIDQLKTTRIGHGIGAAVDEMLQDYLAAHKNITLDICPTSNYKLQLVNSYEEHPVRSFLKKGISFSISTDDPLYFNTTLQDEYYILYKHCGFSMEDFQKINRQAVEGSFASPELKSELSKTIAKANCFNNKSAME